MEDCVFCKIVKGEIPTNFVYQDDDIAVFDDIRHVSPVHLLFIPKNHIGDFHEAPESIIIKIKNKIIEKINELSLTEKGYRIIINGGTAKAVPHLHFHLMGGISKEKIL